MVTIITSLSSSLQLTTTILLLLLLLLLRLSSQRSAAAAEEKESVISMIITIEEVSQHKSSDDCWSVLYNVVYDLTDYGSNHNRGGGPDRVWDSCGTDYTTTFDAVHGGNQRKYLQWPGIVEIGSLSSTTTTTTGPLPPPLATPLPTPRPDPTPAPTPPTTPPVPIVTTSPPTNSPTTFPSPEPTTPELHVSTSPPTTTSDAPIPISSTTIAPHEEMMSEESTTTMTMEPTTSMETTTDPDSSSTVMVSTPTTNPPTSSEEDDDSSSSTTTDDYDESTINNILLTFEDLAEHDSSDDCWIVFYDKVYNLTEYAYRHPPVGGGETAIHPYCGQNGTDAYIAVHDGNTKNYLDIYVSDVVVGTIVPSNETTNLEEDTDFAAGNIISDGNDEVVIARQPIISDDEVRMHTTADDCWIIFHDSVYDMTQYAYSHPGPGELAIHPWCGSDGTTAFDVFHPDRQLLTKIEYTKVGGVVSSSSSSSVASSSFPRVLLLLLLLCLVQSF